MKECVLTCIFIRKENQQKSKNDNLFILKSIASDNMIKFYKNDNLELIMKPDF